MSGGSAGPSGDADVLWRVIDRIEADQRAARRFFDGVLRDAVRLQYVERPRFLQALVERARGPGS